MKRLILQILILLCFGTLEAQNQFHVFPKSGQNPGTAEGNGSLDRPWDLQSALTQSPDIVRPGDTIWIHSGTYNGRYISTLSSNDIRRKIVVAPFKNDKVILNGNIKSNKKSVLQVKGNNVVYKNFEVTFIGTFSRDETDKAFMKVDGISHVSGVNCVFINLKIHNNPGIGFGSWKRAGGSIIAHCQIFHNGFMGTKRGRGPGMYVQNESEQIRVIKNNIIFNNYYKGIEVWSAAKRANNSYVKNVTLNDNIIFNNGLPSGKFTNNILVATDDRNGINIAKNIDIRRNVLYHNTNYENNQVGGHGPTLSLGNSSKVILKDIRVEDNYILGRNNALRINDIQGFTFKGNTVYAGYVHFYNSAENNMDTWITGKNKYFTKNSRPFRFISKKDLTMKQWQQEKSPDLNSSWQLIKSFDMPSVLHFSKIPSQSDEYQIALFNKQSDSVSVDLKKYEIAGMKYQLLNIATDEVVQEGSIGSNGRIAVSLGTQNKTIDNFAVFKLKVYKGEKKRRSFLNRVFGWLF